MQPTRRSSSSWPEAQIPLGGGRHLSLGEMIGSGSFSNVYRATLCLPYGLVRPVAVKMFRLGNTEDLDLAAHAVRRSMQQLTLVNHPNVVQTHELALFEGHPILISELVEGSDLAELMAHFAKEKRHVPLDLALFVATEMAEAMEGVRLARDLRDVQLNMLHLDLAPGDVRLSRHGEVKVGGFGMGPVRQAGSGVQSLKGMAKRAALSAPEIARGEPGEAQSDVFSVGMLLREMLVGPRLPQNVSDSEAVKLAREGYVHPVLFTPHLPDEVRKVIERAISPEASQRHANGSALAYELRRVAFGLGVGDGRPFLRSMLAEMRDMAIPQTK